MAGERTLKVTILGDADKLKRAFGDAAREADGFGSKLSGVAKTAGIALAGLSAGGVVIAKNAVDAASDLAEVQSKTKVIFGNASKDIEAFANNAARDFGQTKTQAMEAASTFATFGKAAGLQNKDLTDFSKKMTGLASDLASFHNTKPEEAVAALGAAMRGESEPLRRYGVMLDDATLKAAAMELGIYDGTGALDAQQKTLAAQKVIMEQTSDAQGDFARTSDGLANQQRILEANLGNVSAKIGTALLPAMTGITTVASEIMTAFSEGGWSGAMDKVAEIWGELWPKIKAKLGELISALGDWIVAEGPGILRQLGEWTTQFLAWAADMGLKLLAKLGEWIQVTVLPWLADQAPKWLRQLGEWTLAFLGWAADMGVKLLARLGAWIVDTVLPWVVDQAPKLLAKLGEWTAQFLLWVAEMNVKLLARLGEWVVTDLLPWIGDQAVKLLAKLGEWTAQFVSWAAGLPTAMASAMAGLFTWIGNQAANLPGQLAHWTGQFVSWVGGLGAAAADAIAAFAADLGRAVLKALKDAANPLNWLPSLGTDKTGGTGIVPGYGGVPVPNGSTPGGAPTNSQGGSGPTIAQMFAAGKSISQIAQETGLDPAVITGMLVSQIPGSVLGGDLDETDHSNDGDLSPSGPGEANLTSNAVKLRREIAASFKGYSSIGGYAYRTTAAGTPSDHATGKALDVMLPGLRNPLGDKIAGWAAGQSETKYVIWDNQIWSRSKPTWRDYATSGAVGKANQGSATGRHEDHVHISVLGQGGVIAPSLGGTLAVIGEAGQHEIVAPVDNPKDPYEVANAALRVAGLPPLGTSVIMGQALTPEQLFQRQQIVQAAFGMLPPTVHVGAPTGGTHGSPLPGSPGYEYPPGHPLGPPVAPKAAAPGGAGINIGASEYPAGVAAPGRPGINIGMAERFRKEANGDVYVTVNVHGNVLRDRDLAETVRNGLLDLQRQGVSLGFN